MVYCSFGPRSTAIKLTVQVRVSLGATRACSEKIYLHVHILGSYESVGLQHISIKEIKIFYFYLIFFTSVSFK